MNKVKTKRVEKTDKLNQRKLKRIANHYGIPPISVRELQLGFPEDLPVEAANRLIKDGFVKSAKTKLRTKDIRVKNLTPEFNKPTITSEDKKVFNIDNDKIEDIDDDNFKVEI